MSYLPALTVVAVGLLLLVVLTVQVRRHLREFTRAADAVRTRLGHERGTLRARLAALQVAMTETRARVKHAPVDDVRSISRGRQEEDRG